MAGEEWGIEEGAGELAAAATAPRPRIETGPLTASGQRISPFKRFSEQLQTGLGVGPLGRPVSTGEDPLAAAPPRPMGPPPPPPIPEAMRGRYGGRYYAPGAEGPMIDVMLAEGSSPATQAAASRALEGWRQHQQTPMGLLASRTRLALEAGETEAQTAKTELALFARQRAKEADIAAKQAEFEKGQADVEAKRQRAYEQATLRYEEQQREADRAVAETTIEDRRTGGQRLLDGLAAALGALGAGLTGQPNDALRIIEARIDRDIESQREQLKSRREKAGAVKNELGAYLQAFGEEGRAIEALRARRYAQYAAMSSRVAGEAEGARAKWKLLEIAKLTDARGRDTELGLQQTAVADQLAQERAAAQAQAAALAARPKEWQVSKGAKRDLESLYVSLGPGAGGIAPTAADAEKVRTALENQRKMVDKITRVEQLVAAGGTSYGAKELGEVKSLSADLATDFGVQKQLGALSEADLTIAQDFFGGDPTEMRQRKPRTLAGLAQAKRNIEAGIRSKMTSLGMPIVERRITPGGPEYRYTGQIGGTGAAGIEEGPPQE